MTNTSSKTLTLKIKTASVTSDFTRQMEEFVKVRGEMILKGKKVERTVMLFGSNVAAKDKFVEGRITKFHGEFDGGSIKLTGKADFIEEWPYPLVGTLSQKEERTDSRKRPYVYARMLIQKTVNGVKQTVERVVMARGDKPLSAMSQINVGDTVNFWGKFEDGDNASCINFLNVRQDKPADQSQAA